MHLPQQPGFWRTRLTLGLVSIVFLQCLFLFAYIPYMIYFAQLISRTGGIAPVIILIIQELFPKDFLRRSLVLLKSNGNNTMEEFAPPASSASTSSSLKTLQLPSLSMPSTSDIQNSAAESFQHLISQSAFPNNIYSFYNTPPTMDNSLVSDDLTSTYMISNPPILKTQFNSPITINTSLLPLSQTQSVLLIGEVDIIIEQQPPSDVRTRTPNDRRTFNCVIRVVGDYIKNNVCQVLAQLAYANSHTERPSQDILGGNKVVTVGKDGKVVFDSLSMTEASTKHQENEFCLEYILLTEDNKRFILTNGTPFVKRSRPFYAYSNQKVLSRRRNVTLRTLSSNKGTTVGGDQMHVVGSPFIRCNSLRCIFHTPHGDIPANNIELYSESVLFFTLPPYPAPPNFCPPDGTELPVQVVITNDGRNYSNPLPFTYIFENGSTKRLRSRF
eukprot:gene7276-8456_t